VVRHFPRATRRTAQSSASSRSRRVVAAVAAAGLLAGPVALPSAFAEDLDEKQDKVEGQIDKAEEHLDHSSAELEAATAKLLAAREELSSAQAYLAKTQGELAAAEALDREMQARLDAAIERLNKAQLALDEGEAVFAEQEAQLRQMVVAAYEQGDPALMGLSMVFTTQDPAQLTGKLNADDTVVDVETTILDQLEAGKVLLQVKEAELEEAKADVAVKRREAAENLRRKEALELQAREAKQQVAELVVAREKATKAALKAKNADLAIINKLEAERDRIEALIAAKATMSSFTGYVDGGGVLAMPVDGYITSPFGWRTHPIWGYRSLHDGVDFGAACGTPIRAAADGVVISEYFQSAWGNRIIIDHGLHKGVGLSTISNHLSGYAVPTGAKVERGQVVGYVGTTGWSTGCHLHYTVNQNGVPVDPMNWF
jgi:murein DD-endopeptidase MepM/ murein hydrolase activator NlpD